MKTSAQTEVIGAARAVVYCHQHNASIFRRELAGAWLIRCINDLDSTERNARLSRAGRLALTAPPDRQPIRHAAMSIRSTRARRHSTRVP